MSEYEIAENKYVEFTYTISGDDGNLLESSQTPLHYIHGSDNEVFAKIENALNGCVPGDRVQVSISSEESYGQHLQELVFTDNIINVPEQYRELGA